MTAFGTAFLTVLLIIVAWAVILKTQKEPDWRLQVCTGHGGDGIETCGSCSRQFCRECDPEGHCAEE